MSTSASHGKSDCSSLLGKVLTAHGGLENWERVHSLRADVVLGGPFWSMLGWPYGELKLTASLDARRQHITLGSFTAPDRIAVFDVEPQRLSIQTTDGVLVEQRDDPRSSFPPFDRAATEWDPIQVAYFLSAAHWNYLTQPFSFTYPGVEAREIEPWDEGGETWRRLAVGFPKWNANHGADQLFYYDTDFMLRRMDYAAEVTGNSPVAHYTHDPETFDGFVFPTRRRIHRRDADGIADQSAAAITLDVAQVTVEAAQSAQRPALIRSNRPSTPADIPMQRRMLTKSTPA
jgi:hypothetical protein